jgi:RNase P subunit RPR2
MASGLIVFSLMIVVLGFGFFMTLIRAPRCAKCHTPLQPVAEATRALGAHVVETIIYYECPDCYQAMERKFLHTHVS